MACNTLIFSWKGKRLPWALATTALRSTVAPTSHYSCLNSLGEPSDISHVMCYSFTNRGSLFYLTTIICHFPLLLRRVFGGRYCGPCQYNKLAYKLTDRKQKPQLSDKIMALHHKLPPTLMPYLRDRFNCENLFPTMSWVGADLRTSVAERLVQFSSRL
jgi:hypothetical protein